MDINGCFDKGKKQTSLKEDDAFLLGNRALDNALQNQVGCFLLGQLGVELKKLSQLCDSDVIVEVGCTDNIVMGDR